MSDMAFVDVNWAGRRARIEHRWVAATNTQAPLLVFLHEGLGSVSMWRDFPDRLCAAAACRGLMYSRPGYGQSTPRDDNEHWGVDFMHRQADELLPVLFNALHIHQDTEATPPWLFGHSDGGSIALLHAAHFSAPGGTRRVAGTIVVAPHIFVEDVSVASIERARQAYEQGELRERFARHHANPDSAFYGWNNAWLNPAFRGWSIEEELRAITCPLLAVQGVNDEYGTLAQIRGIAQQVPHTRLLELQDCGHSPHRDQPDALAAAAARFIAQHTA